MSRSLVVHLALYVGLALLALAAWRRDRRLGPLAAYVGWMASVDVVLAVLGRYPRAPHPLHGLARVRFHFEEWLFLGCSFLFVAVCVHYFVGRRARGVLLLWAVVCLVCLYYPAMTGAPLLRLYSIVSTGTLVASIACVAWGLFVRRELEIGLAHLIVLLYVLTDAALRAVSFTTLFADWSIGRAANLALLSACCLAYVGWLVGRARTTSSS